MEFFEDKFKDRFKDAQSTEGIDADELWGQIAEALPEEEPAKKAGFISKRYLLLLSIFLLLLCTALFFVLKQKDHKIEVTAQSQKATNTLIADKQKSNRNTSEQLSNSSDKLNGEKIEVEHIEQAVDQHTVKHTSPLSVEEQHLSKKTPATIQQNNGVSSSATIFEEKETNIHQATSTDRLIDEVEIAKNKQTQVASILEQAQTSNKNKQLVEEEEQQFDNTASAVIEERESSQEEQVLPTATTNAEQTSNKGEQLIEEVAPLAITDNNAVDLLATLSFLVAYEKQAIQVPLADVQQQNKTSTKTRKRTSLPLSVGLSYGTNIWMDFFENNTNLSQLYKDGYSPILGSKVGLDVQWRFNDQWHAESGLAYLVAKSKFDYQEVTNTTMHRDNDPTQELINAIATRTVRHYNKLKFFSLPVLLAYTASADKIEWGLAAGVGLNFIGDQTGKSVDSNELIQAYASSDDALPYSKFFVSYQLKPFVNYQLNEQLKLQFKPDVTYQTFKQSDFFGIKHSAISMGLNVGLCLNLE